MTVDVIVEKHPYGISCVAPPLASDSIFHEAFFGITRGVAAIRTMKPEIDVTGCDRVRRCEPGALVGDHPADAEFFQQIERRPLQPGWVARFDGKAKSFVMKTKILEKNSDLFGMEGQDGRQLNQYRPCVFGNQIKYIEEPGYSLLRIIELLGVGDVTADLRTKPKTGIDRTLPVENG